MAEFAKEYRTLESFKGIDGHWSYVRQPASLIDRLLYARSIDRPKGDEDE